MKKLVLSLFVLTLAVAVHAQETKEGPRDRDKRKHHHEMPFDKLNLSEDQKAKFKSENEAFRQKMSELKKNDNATVKDYKAKMESLRKDHHSKMNGLLSPDQKLQMEKMKTDRKAMHENREKGNMDRMKTKLGLSDEQATRMNKSRTELSEKMKALRSDEKLGSEQKKEKMKELMKEHKEKTKSILTEEQLKKLKEGHERGKRSPKTAVI